MDGDRLRRDRNDVTEVARSGSDWVSFAIEVTDTVQKAIPFDRCNWHTVGPGTVLFTGSVNRDVSCPGTWLAEHEYAIEDVNKWWFAARSGHRAGATSLATHGDLSRSPRHRSQESYGIGDELRASFVAGDTYWGAAACLRDATGPGPQKTTCRAHLPGGRALDRPAGRGATTRDAVAVEDGPSNPHHRCREHELCCTLSVGEALVGARGSPVDVAPCQSRRWRGRRRKAQPWLRPRRGRRPAANLAGETPR
ncbi:MAG: hypothetical protein ACRDZS_06185 [Acidimicrobiales bacterium]